MKKDFSEIWTRNPLILNKPSSPLQEDTEKLSKACGSDWLILVESANPFYWTNPIKNKENTSNSLAYL